MDIQEYKIALIAPFPIRSQFGSQLKFNTRESSEHPTTWVLNQVKLLSEREPRFELHIISLSPHLAEDSHFCDGEINYHFLRGTRFSRQAVSLYRRDRYKIQRILTQIQPDLIQAFGTEGPYAYSGVTSPYPCLINIQGIVREVIKQVPSLPPNLQWLHLFITQFFERFTIRKGKHFLVNNRYSSNFIETINKQAQIFEIPNLINPIYFSLDKTSSPRDVNLIYVGAITERKGAVELLQAFSQTHKKFPASRLFMVGSINKNIQPRIEKILAEHNISRYVEFTGLKPPEYIAELFRNPAILVHPSWVDSSPNSVYEAMAAGLPVVAYKVGGLPYMVKHNHTGMLVKPHDLTELVNAINYFLSSPEETKRMGENARLLMLTEISPDSVVKRIVDVYWKILESEHHNIYAKTIIHNNMDI